jgi:hypothetical protein
MFECTEEKWNALAEFLNYLNALEPVHSISLQYTQTLHAHIHIEAKLIRSFALPLALASPPLFVVDVASLVSGLSLSGNKGLTSGPGSVGNTHAHIQTHAHIHIEAKLHSQSRTSSRTRLAAI